MIDTSKFTLDCVTFKPNCDLELKRGTTNLRTGEPSKGGFLFNAGSVAVRGTGAYRNSDGFFLDVSPRSYAPEIVDVTVHFSVAGQANDGDNYRLTDKDGTARVLQELQAWLDDAGVVTNVLSALPSRIDLTRNFEFEHRFEDYAVVYAAMTPERLEPAEYGTAYLWKNSAQEITAYDKIVEMAIKAKREKRNFKPSNYGTNVQRLEWRLFGRDKIKTALKAERVSDILDGFDGLETKYHAALKRQLFKRSPDANRELLLTANARAAFRHFIDEGERFWFEKYWLGLPLSFLSEKDLKAIIRAAKEESPNRNTPSRIAGKLKTYKMDALHAVKVTSGKTAADLYREMQEKVLSKSG